MAKKKVRKKPSDTANPEIKAKAGKIYRKLRVLYPDAHCALDYENAWQLLMATILSAQCTDKRVNMVTPHLFAAYATPKELGKAKQKDVEKIIRSTGFYRNKATSLIESSHAIDVHFDGEVPKEMEDLLTLRGVARKTANVVLGNAYDINVGVVVDTHIGRLSRRMGFSLHKDPTKVEKDLMLLFPRKNWTMLAHLMIYHGRAICDARKPDCENCKLIKLCDQNDIPKAKQA